MLEENAGNLIVLNKQLQSSENLNGFSLEGKQAVYEVIRIIDGTPLYFEDHYKRMESSLKALGLNAKDTGEGLNRQIRGLVEAEGLSNCNVKVVAYLDGGVQNTLCHISKSYYPPEEVVLQGVPVSLLQLERNNPNVKQVNLSYKEAVSRKMKEDNVFEVLLVNQEGKLTEGSKSNLFFIQGNKVLTAPGDTVLKGITRNYIMDTCRAAGYEVVETLVDVKELDRMDGLFISGTSIKVLPVSSIDGKPFASAANQGIQAIREHFDQVIGKYISAHQG